MASGSSGKASSSRKSSSGGGSKSGSLEAAKKKKKSKKSSSSSKAASASAAASRQNKAAAAAKARTTIKSMYDESEARKNDAAWLGSERLSAAAASLEGYYKRSTMVPGRGRVKKNAATGLFLAEEVGIVDAALKTNGMNREDLTVEAFGCLLEQARRFALEIINDAQDYAGHCSRSEIKPSDLHLAVEFRDEGLDEDGGSSHLPPPNRIAKLAEEVNRALLPPIPENCYNGIVLPDPEYQLTARTFDVVTSAQVAHRMGRGGTVPPQSIFGAFAKFGSTKDFAASPKASSKSKGGSSSKRKRSSGSTSTSYGATKSKAQVSINLKKS